MGKVLTIVADRNEFLRAAKHPKDKKNRVSVDTPESLDWLKWRLILKKVATLQELEQVYDLADLFCAHLALDIQDEVEYLQAQEINKE